MARRAAYRHHRWIRATGVCASQLPRANMSTPPSTRVVRSEWRHTRCQYKSGSWPRAVRASLDRVSGVEGGGASRRLRLHRHEPRGGGRDTPSCEQPHTSHVALLVLTFDLACVTCKALACVAGARDRASVRSEGVLYFCYYNKRVRDFTQDFRVVCVPHTCRDALVESRACRVCAPRHHTVVCAISAVIGWASFK